MVGSETRAEDIFLFEIGRTVVAVVKVCLHETRLVWEQQKRPCAAAKVTLDASGVRKYNVCCQAAKKKQK